MIKNKNIKKTSLDYDISMKTIRRWMKLKNIRKKGKYPENIKVVSFSVFFVNLYISKYFGFSI